MRKFFKDLAAYLMSFGAGIGARDNFGHKPGHVSVIVKRPGPNVRRALAEYLKAHPEHKTES